MLEKKIYFIIIFFFSCLLFFTGCDVRKKVNTEKTKEIIQSTLESNDKTKDLKFYFRRPALRAELIYDDDLNEQDFEYLINKFKILIDIDFMQEIGDKYWNGEMAWGFYLNIYIEEKLDAKPDYELSTKYLKTNYGDEEPNNIDGFKTWYIEDKDYNVKIIEP